MKRIILALCCLVLGLQVIFADTLANVTISVSGNDIIISWSDSTNADMFYIYRSTYPDSGFVKIDSTATTSYTDIEGGNEIMHFYYVTANLTLTDIDGNVYQTVQIGDQLWMAENLKVTHYRNGDPILNVTVNSEWGLCSHTGKYCYYNNSSANGDTYGALYNWFAVDDSRGLAPDGWHVPTDAEIMELEMYLGMSYSEAHNIGDRGTNEGSKLAGGYDLWGSGNLKNDPEFDSSGFSFLPGGYRYYYSGYFSDQGTYGYLWTSTEFIINTGFAWSRDLFFYYTTVDRDAQNKRSGYSVRCIRD